MLPGRIDPLRPRHGQRPISDNDFATRGDDCGDVVGEAARVIDGIDFVGAQFKPPDLAAGAAAQAEIALEKV